MPPPIQTIRPFLVKPGDSSALIWWTFSNNGVVLLPTSTPCKLYDPNGVQRDPTDTSLTTAATFTPSFDLTGSLTGTVGAAYININMAATAPEGMWYISCGLGPATPDANVGFYVERPRITLGGEVETGTATLPVAAFYKDIQNLLLLPNPVDFNSAPMRELMDNYVLMAQGEFETRTGAAFWPVTVSEEVLDINAWRQVNGDTFMPNQIFAKRPILLQHRPLCPFDSTRGHKAEFYRGAEAPLPVDGSSPLREWDDQLTSASGLGRADGDFWVDHMRGFFYLRNTFMVRRGSVLRFTYEYGKPITQLTQPAHGQPQTVFVKSTYRYSTRGFFRIGRTYIFHTGKTATAFTGCRWGVLGTQAEDYNICSEVYEVPDGVRAGIIKRSAALFLSGDAFIAAAGDSQGTADKISEKIDRYNKEFDMLCQQSFQKWANA